MRRSEREIANTAATQAEDLDDLLEEEIPEAPPRPSRRRNNGQEKSRRGFVKRSSWPCPECGWRATGHNWQRLKAEHIRKNHADVADRFGKAEARIAMVPWSPECIWKCRVEGWA